MAASHLSPTARSPMYSQIPSLNIRESLPHCDVCDLTGQLQRKEERPIGRGSFGSVHIYESKPNSLLRRASNVQLFAVKEVRFFEEQIQNDNLQRIKEVSVCQPQVDGR